MSLAHTKLKMLMKVLALGSVLSISLAAILNEKSQGQITRTRTITLRSGDSLQAALRAARFGDTIILPAGATFVGPIVLPYKGVGSDTDADYITIRTSELSGIAAADERLKPALHARAMPRIVSPHEKAALTTEPRAHHYKFIGVEFLPAADAGYVFNVVDLGSGDYISLDQFPHHLIFDRCYVHSTGLNRARRGFAINSAETSIINSHVSGFAGAGDETQAIAGWNGPGPFHIVNNYLEGAGEVVMIGGADPSVPNLVPSDIEFRRNYLRKPKEWLGRAGIKGTFELKNARRVVVEGNLIENEILTTAIVLTVRNQGGKAPWSTIEDVEISNNIIRHASSGVNILGSDNERRSQEAKRIRVVNNLFQDIVANDPNDIPYFLQVNGGQQITVAHNTVQQAGNIITAYGSPARSFVFRDNIVLFNSYGIVCQVQGPECGSENIFCNCFPGGVFRGNIFADNLGAAARDNLLSRYPAGNSFSRAIMTASDGRKPGANLEAITNAGAEAARTGNRFVTK